MKKITSTSSEQRKTRRKLCELFLKKVQSNQGRINLNNYINYEITILMMGVKPY